MIRETHLTKAFYTLAALLVILVPMVVSGSLYFPYITGKNLIFRVIVMLMVGVWVALVVKNKAYVPSRTFLFWAFAAWVLALLISAIAGPHTQQSIWSNFERMEGWITLLHLFLLFIALAGVLRTWKQWKNLFMLSVGVSVLVAIYGVVQYLSDGVTRISALFGNSTYLAAYALFHVFIALLMVVRENERVRRSVAQIFRTPSVVFLLTSVFLNIFVVYRTGTRGTILGLLGGIGISALLVALKGRSHPRARKVAIGSVLTLILVVGIFFGLKNTALVQESSVLKRFADINISEQTTRSRFMVWGMALEGVAERPLFGWGQENFIYVFDKHYNPQMFDQEPWFDRTHNVFLDWLVAGGIIGFLAYFAVFGGIIYMIWRARHVSVLEKSLITGLLGGYFIHNLFVFDNITSYMLYVFIAAYVQSRSSHTQEDTKESEPLITSQTLRDATAFGALVCALLITVLLNRPGYVQARTLIDALQAFQGQDVSEALVLFQKAEDIGAYGTQEVREQIFQVAQALRRAAANQEIQRDFFQYAIAAGNRQMDEDPRDARTPVLLGYMFQSYGQYNAATEMFERARILSPTKPSILLQLASVRHMADDVEGALGVAEQAFELAPNYSEARILYASELIATGEDEKAQSLLKEEFGDDVPYHTGLVRAYIATQDKEALDRIFAGELDGGEPQMYVTYAAALYEAGFSAAARSVLEKGIEEYPEHEGQFNGFIQQLDEEAGQ